MADTPDLAKLSDTELEAAFREADAARVPPRIVEGEEVEIVDEREIRAVLLGRARDIVLELNRRRLAR